MDKQELKELTASILDRLRQNIKDGEKEKALVLVDEIDRQKHAFDESYREWLDLMLTYIADNMGEEAVYQIHRANGENTLLPMLGWIFETKNIEEKVRRRAMSIGDTGSSALNFLHPKISQRQRGRATSRKAAKSVG